MGWVTKLRAQEMESPLDHEVYAFDPSPQQVPSAIVLEYYAIPRSSSQPSVKFESATSDARKILSRFLYRPSSSPYTTEARAGNKPWQRPADIRNNSWEELFKRAFLNISPSNLCQRRTGNRFESSG